MNDKEFLAVLLVVGLGIAGWFWFLSHLETECSSRPCPEGYERVLATRPLVCACVEVTP